MALGTWKLMSIHPSLEFSQEVLQPPQLPSLPSFWEFIQKSYYLDWIWKKCFVSLLLFHSTKVMIHCYSVYVDIEKNIIRLRLTPTRGRLATLVYYWAPSSACWVYLEPCPWTARVSCFPFSLSPPCWTSRGHVFHQPSIFGSLSSTWGKERPEIKSFSTIRILCFIDFNTKQHLTGYNLEKDNLQWLPDGFHSPVPATRHHPAILR